MSKFTTSPPAWMQSRSGGASASGGGVSLMNLSASVGIDASAFSSGIASIQSSIETLNANITEMLTLIGDIAVNTQSTLMLLSADASEAAVAIAAAVEGASDEEIADAQAGIAALKEMYGETAETAESISDATDEIGEAVDSGSISFETMASKASAALNTIKNIASAIWDVGASLVETASDREMNERQFNAVFAGMEGDAVTLLSDLAESTGLYETIIRDNMAKAYLQFKSAGLDENDAIEATAHAINYAADAAAMYGTSMDDATQRLLSFMRGNVEAGEAIGLFAGMGSRDEFASRLFDGAKWKDLDEAQRHLALLAIAQQTYANANVHGKSAEYADSYAISLQNLKARVEELKAALGEPIMDAVTPIIEELSAWIDANPDAVQALADAIGAIVDGIAELVINLSNFLQQHPEILSILTGLISRVPSFLETALGSTTPSGVITTQEGYEQVIGEEYGTSDTPPQADTASDWQKFQTLAEAALTWDYYGDMNNFEQALHYAAMQRDQETMEDALATYFTTEEVAKLIQYLNNTDALRAFSDRDSIWRKNEEGKLPNEFVQWVEENFGLTPDPSQGGLLSSISDLPDSITSAITAALPSAFAGVGVYMDGQLVGHLVAPTVMGDMARSARNNMHTGTNT